MTISAMRIIASCRRGRKLALGSMLILFANVVPVSAADSAMPSAADLENLRERISTLDQDLTRDRDRRDQLAAELEAAERSIADAVVAQRKSKAEVALAQRELAAATVARKQAEQSLARSRVELGKALRASYIAGGGGRLQGFFQGYDAAATARIDAGTRAVARAIDAQIQTLHAQTEQILAAEAALVGAGEALEERRKRASLALAQLQQAQGERREALATLSKRTADRATELADAKSEQARLQKLMEDLRKALRDKPMKFEKGVPLPSQRGRLPWPLRGPLLAKFGAEKAGGQLSWSGWWIGAPQGAPIRAVADGRAVYVGFVQRYGLVVILDHPGEFLSLYGHVESSSVEVGESIAAGSIIAAAGNSGGHDQTGVYFEIRQGTEPVDPAKWLAP